MKYIKYFESEEILLKNPLLYKKVQCIIDMYKYLSEHKQYDYDHFVSKAEMLFVLSNEYKKRTIDRNINIDAIVKSALVEGSVQQELTNDLYKFAKEIHGKNTPEYIEEIIKPFVNSSLFIGDYKIGWYYRDWDKKTCFKIEVNLDPELFEIDEKDVMGKNTLGTTHWVNVDKIPVMRRLQADFNRYRQIIKHDIDNMKLDQYKFRYELYDSSAHNCYYVMYLILIPIN